jgi:hypothetical protein
MSSSNSNLGPFKEIFSFGIMRKYWEPVKDNMIDILMVVFTLSGHKTLLLCGSTHFNNVLSACLTKFFFFHNHCRVIKSPECEGVIID